MAIRTNCQRLSAPVAHFLLPIFISGQQLHTPDFVHLQLRARFTTQFTDIGFQPLNQIRAVPELIAVGLVVEVFCKRCPLVLKAVMVKEALTRLALQCCRVIGFRIRFSSFYAYCICAAEVSRAGTTVTFPRLCGVTAIAIFCHSPRSCRSDWRSSNPAFILIPILCLPLSRGRMADRLRALLPCYVPRLGFPHGSGSCFRALRLARYLAIGRFAVKPLTGARRNRDRPQ